MLLSKAETSNKYDAMSGYHHIGTRGGVAAEHSFSQVSC